MDWYYYVSITFSICYSLSLSREREQILDVIRCMAADELSTPARFVDCRLAAGILWGYSGI
jgi:hypothetical protein